MRRALLFMLTGVLLLAVMPPASAQVPGVDLPPYPERDEWYAENDSGHFTGGGTTSVRVAEGCDDLEGTAQVACSLAAFEEQPFTVIAFVDSGINPYHHDFRDPDFIHHPAEYIEGYPAGATEVPLSFDVADTDGYADARAEDDGTLGDLDRNQLYWFPGTRIIGGYSTGAGGAGAFPERVIIDENSHGTGVASVAAGAFYGSNPNALIVAVEALGQASLDWATSQPWIDIVSNSWGNIGNVPTAVQADATKAATERGQTVAFAAGNGATNSNSHQVFGTDPADDPCECKTPDSNPSVTNQYGGPSWVLTVGAASPINGQAHWWHSVPVDVSSFGSKWRAASAFGVTQAENRDFGGTSCATPVTAGVLSLVISEARRIFDDPVQGQRPGQAVAVAAEAATLPPTGPLADGVLTRLEAEELVQKTALPVEADPEQLTWDYAVRPTTPAYYVYQGYGVVDRDSRDRALAVLRGEAELEDRSEVDDWIAGVDAVRDVIWN